uniref:Uncharacterized protein n=1 Tax=Anopheles darlingi TaxID=43151 RepID=A0A2M4D7F9_ANODA
MIYLFIIKHSLLFISIPDFIPFFFVILFYSGGLHELFAFPFQGLLIIHYSASSLYLILISRTTLKCRETPLWSGKGRTDRMQNILYSPLRTAQML